jgi:hypothetical protein
MDLVIDYLSKVLHGKIFLAIPVVPSSVSKGSAGGDKLSPLLIASAREKSRLRSFLR